MKYFTVSEINMDDPEEFGTFSLLYATKDRALDVVKQQIFDSLGNDDDEAQEIWDGKVVSEIDERRTKISIFDAEILFVITECTPES